MTEAKRLDLFTRVLALAFLASIAVSGSLWLSSRLYPLVPVAGLIGPFPVVASYALFALLIALLAVLVVRPRARIVLYPLLAVLLLLFLQDQDRLWPSFYEFAFFFLILASVRSGRGTEAESSRILTACRFILAAVYLWSGLLKLTPSFYYVVFPWFLAPVFAHLPMFVPHIPTLALITAVAEALFALALLTVRFRKLAFWEAVTMHALIFFLIGPLRGDWNDSAWTWSLATCAFLVVLYWRAPAFSWKQLMPGVQSSPQAYLAYLPGALAVLCIGMLPALNLVNAWPSPLSFNVYTGNVASGAILIEPRVVPELPPELQAFVRNISPSTSIIDVNAWSAEAFNANPVPTESTFRALLHAVCAQVSEPDAVTLVYQEKSGWGIPSSRSTFSCTDQASITSSSSPSS